VLPIINIMITKRRRQQRSPGSARQGMATGVHNETQPRLTGQSGNLPGSKHRHRVPAEQILGRAGHSSPIGIARAYELQLA
jgi:hypothetical protein